MDHDDRCECEKPGYFCSGVKGIIAHIHNGHIVGTVERCDTCGIYASDADAERMLEKYLFGQKNGPAKEIEK